MEENFHKGKDWYTRAEDDLLHHHVEDNLSQVKDEARVIHITPTPLVPHTSDGSGDAPHRLLGRRRVSHAGERACDPHERLSRAVAEGKRQSVLGRILVPDAVV